MTFSAKKTSSHLVTFFYLIRERRYFSILQKNSKTFSFEQKELFSEFRDLMSSSDFDVSQIWALSYDD